jgi:hypothetical protein
MRLGTSLRTIMSNWFADYHHALLLHLLSGAVMLGVFCIWLLLASGFRFAKRLARHRTAGRTRMQQNPVGSRLQRSSRLIDPTEF